MNLKAAIGDPVLEPVDDPAVHVGQIEPRHQVAAVQPVRRRHLGELAGHMIKFLKFWSWLTASAIGLRPALRESQHRAGPTGGDTGNG